MELRKHIDWDKMSKESCLEIIVAMKEDYDSLMQKYVERGVAMRETGAVVRSIFEPKIKIIREIIDSNESAEQKLGSIQAVLDFKL